MTASERQCWRWASHGGVIGFGTTLPILGLESMYSLRDLTQDVTGFLALALEYITGGPCVIWLELEAPGIRFTRQTAEHARHGRLGATPESHPGRKREIIVEKRLAAVGDLGADAAPLAPELLQVAVTTVHQVRLERQQLEELR